jgi:hypothetical protein
MKTLRSSSSLRISTPRVARPAGRLAVCVTRAISFGGEDSESTSKEPEFISVKKTKEFEIRFFKPYPVGE